MQDFEQKLASMTPRIFIRPVKKPATPLRSFGTAAAGFLLGAGIMYYVMQPEKPRTEYAESRNVPRFVLDDDALQQIRSPMDIVKLARRYEPVKKVAEPDCTHKWSVVSGQWLVDSEM
jgi:hypothetical protein